MRKMYPIDLDQKFRIQAVLARRQDAAGRRLTMASLARALGESYVAVASAIYNNRPGTPRTLEVQARIAEYLGRPVAELFGGNGSEKVEAYLPGQPARFPPASPTLEPPPLARRILAKIQACVGLKVTRNEGGLIAGENEIEHGGNLNP